MRDGIVRQPVFEKPLLAALRREYGRSIRCNLTDLDDLPPRPSAPCQLYVHVPFCESLCPYCSFHRVQFRQDKAQAYFEAVRQEIRLYAERGYQFTDVYIGGGTPTVLPRELARTLELIRSYWPIRWVSVETNPNHLNRETVGILSDAGIDRLSVGVQSFDDELLRQMGRYQHYGSADQTAERLAAVRGRFSTLNVDMMFNFPTQRLDSVERDIETLRALAVEQVSFYPLMRFTSTERNIRKRLGNAGAERRYAFYQQILRGMRPAYQPSSAWCFSRVAPQEIVRPIDEYITQASDYVGVGSGAFSYLDGTLYATSFSLRRYREALAAGRPSITRCSILTTRQRMRYEFLVGLFGLRLPFEQIKMKYGAEFWWRLAPELATMGLIGALRYDAGAIQLTDRGMYCWMLMMAEFFTAVDRVRDAMRLHIREELSAPSIPSITSQPAEPDPDRFRTGRFSQHAS